ncbi:MAG: histidine kinase [Cyanobacteria bacterium RYN_339]|nr:histidine kinase [Cyanobacteria bacterium RYN_339]
MAQRSRALQLGLGLAAGWTLLAATGACEPLERLTARARYLLRPVPTWKAPVTIVALDEASLAAHGRMPWPRAKFAELVDRIRDSGAAVVGVDVAFDEPTADDPLLQQALATLPTVLPAFLAFAGTGDRLTVVEPVPSLTKAAVALGSVQLSIHQQYEQWELTPYQDLIDRRLPAFPVAVVGAYLGNAWAPPRPSLIWQTKTSYLDFRGPARSVPTVSAADVLAGKPMNFSHNIVLVGATAAGLPDTNFVVPDMRRGPMAGVEISAHAIDNLLNDRFLRRFSVHALGLLLLLLAWFPGRELLAEAVLGRRRHQLLAGALVGWLVLAVVAFWAGVWLDVVPAFGVLISCYLVGLAAERGALLKSRNQLLERYASDLATESRRQRERLEGELHDGVQQLLVALGRELRQVRRAMPSPEKLEPRVERMEDISEQIVAEIQRVRRDLMPPALRREGFERAAAAYLEELGAREGVATVLERDGWEPLAQELEVELYWLVREALTNAAKHAQAHTLTLRLLRVGAEARVEVSDDGLGFTPPDLSVPPAGVEHSGLHRMWLRMRGRGGDLEVRSTPGQGTTLCFRLPLGVALERSPSW